MGAGEAAAYGQVSNGNQNIFVNVTPGQAKTVSGMFWVQNNPANGTSPYTNVTITAGNVSKMSGSGSGATLSNTGIPVSVNATSFTLTDAEKKTVGFSFSISQPGVYQPDIQVAFRNPGESLPSPGMVSITVYAANGSTKSSAPRKTADIDADGKAEAATDSNGDSSDGYENYTDFEGNSLALAVDGDGDGKKDFLVDIDSAGNFDKYWDPDSSIINSLFSAEGRLVIDADNNGLPEKVYSSGQVVAISRLDADADNDGDEDMVFDLNSNGVRDAEDRIWEGALFTLPDLHPVSIEFSKNSPVKGDVIQISAKIRNSGGYAANNFQALFMVDRIIKDFRTESLGAGAEKTIQFSWNASTGTHSMGIALDPQDFVKESNALNDNMTREIQATETAAAGDTPAAQTGQTQTGGAGGQSGGGAGGNSAPSSPSPTDSGNGSSGPDEGSNPGSGGTETSPASSDEEDIIIEDDASANGSAGGSRPVEVTGNFIQNNAGVIAAIIAVIAIAGAVVLKLLFAR
ncbi:hypothetical protein HY642_06170 [Candidatus Woesearchaeota archaeon]|nr:hypothetical protein [Candidatus Woesearchaeota archaeon]